MTTQTVKVRAGVGGRTRTATKRKAVAPSPSTQSTPAATAGPAGRAILVRDGVRMEFAAGAIVAVCRIDGIHDGMTEEAAVLSISKEGARVRFRDDVEYVSQWDQIGVANRNLETAGDIETQVTIDTTAEAVDDPASVAGREHVARVGDLLSISRTFRHLEQQIAQADAEGKVFCDGHLCDLSGNQVDKLRQKITDAHSAAWELAGQIM